MIQPKLSVTQPLAGALGDFNRILFPTPFPWRKWLLLGFCSFLAGLGSGRSIAYQFVSQGLSWLSMGRTSRFSASVPGVNPVGFAHAHHTLALLAASALLVLLVAAWLVCNWLATHGQFMLLDGIVRNRALVARPWREFAPEAHSLLAFRLSAVLVLALALLGVAAACLRVGWPDIERHHFARHAAAAVALGAALLPPIVLLAGAVWLILTDFVVPAMYQRRLAVLPAWGVVRR